MALLRLLHAVAPELELKLCVAHLDHGARGDAGAADAAFVAGLAGSLGVPIELGGWEPAGKGGFEAEARGARYAWLAEVARRQGAAAVAVGHTRDDQAETILQRIVRGTGLKGLGGMPAERRLGGEGVMLIRPLLDCERGALRAWLQDLEQPWREDASNGDTSRTRARIRHVLLPGLARTENPRVVEALVRLGKQARGAQGGVDHLAKRLALAATMETGPGGIALRADLLEGLPGHLMAEVLRQAWREAGWGERAMTAKRWLRMAGAINTGRERFDTGGGVRFQHDGPVIRLKRGRETAAQPPAPEAGWVSIPGEEAWGAGRLVVREVEGVADSSEGETLDRDALVPYETADGRPILWIRGSRPGDRFDPLGLGGHEQRLVDFLRGRRVPIEGRGRVPLVCDRGGIVWVVGHRIAHRARRTGRTGRLVNLRWVDA